jgi:catechol O-methyltransferase
MSGKGVETPDCGVYDCFGPDDDEEDTNERGEVGSTAVAAQHQAQPHVNISIKDQHARRDDSCGILAFHPNTEKSLLISVKKQVMDMEAGERKRQGRDYADDPADSRALEVLKAVDDFCLERHWMMHMGPQKGGDILIKTALQQSLMLYQKQHAPLARQFQVVNSTSRTLKPKFVVVELGTYCGYSAIRMALRLKRESDLKESSGFDFSLHTLEVNEEYANIARQLIALAGLTEYVTVTVYDPETESIVEALKPLLLDVHNNNLYDDQEEGEEHNNIAQPTLPLPPQIQFLVLDHDKDAYLTDLQLLEQAGYIQPLSVVCADNVVFAQISNYMTYTLQLHEQGIVSTQLITSEIEYATPRDTQEHGIKALQDGVGKCRPAFKKEIIFTILMILIMYQLCFLAMRLQKSRHTLNIHQRDSHRNLKEFSYKSEAFVWK